MARGIIHYRMIKAKISGGMSREWLSNLAKSDFIKSAVADVALEAQHIADDMAAGIGPARVRHTKASTLGPGIWNYTNVIHPESSVAITHPDILDTAASRAGARKKER